MNKVVILWLWLSTHDSRVGAQFCIQMERDFVMREEIHQGWLEQTEATYSVCQKVAAARLEEEV